MSSIIFAVGVFLNLLGIIFTIKASFNVWRAYGPGPFWPWANRALLRGKATLKRLSPWNRKGKSIHIQVCDSAVVGLSESVKVRKRFGFKDESASTEKRICRLEGAVLGLYEELDGNETDAQKHISALRESISKLEQKVDEDSRRLEAFSKEAVSSDVRLQLIGLLLIGFGTLLSSVAQFLK